VAGEEGAGEDAKEEEEDDDGCCSKEVVGEGESKEGRREDKKWPPSRLLA
jgi:hypothetical protein